MTRHEHPARPAPRKVNLTAALATFDEPWSPRIVGHYNGNKIFLAKAKGELVCRRAFRGRRCSALLLAR